MVEPISLLVSLGIGALIGVGVVGAIVVIFILIIKIIDLIKWFREKKGERIDSNQKNLIAGSVGAKIKDGTVKEIDCGLFNHEEQEYQMVQFLYDPENEEIVEMRGVRSESISKEVEEAHRGEETVVYKNV